MKTTLAPTCLLTLIPILAAHPLPPAQTFQIDGPGIRWPGRYPVRNGHSVPLYTVLYLSGGFCNFADQRKVHILRPQAAKTLAFQVDTTDPEVLLNFQVKPGDHLTVASYRPIGDFLFGKPVGLQRR